MSRTSHASLYELIAAQLVQAIQVFANALTFEALLLAHQGHAPGASWAALKDSTWSVAELKAQVDRLLERSKALLMEAGGQRLREFAEERSTITDEFARLMNKAGVLHDYVQGTAMMAPPDMTTWAWRRLAVTDQHARAVTSSAKSALNVLNRLINPQALERPVLIDFRHYYESRNISTSSEALYLTLPFWSVHMPRIGVGLAVHECAHSVAGDILKREVRDTSTYFYEYRQRICACVIPLLGVKWTKAYRDELRGRNIAAALESLREHERRRVEGTVDLVLGELLTDILSMMLLGPAYITNIAESLIGSYKVVSDGRPRDVHHVPHSVRIQLLLAVLDCDLLKWGKGEEWKYLIDQVRASVTEYSALNSEVRNRTDWDVFQRAILENAIPGLCDLIERWSYQPGTKDLNSIVAEARKNESVKTYCEVWRRVNDDARDFNGRPETLLRALEEMTEVLALPGSEWLKTWP